MLDFYFLHNKIISKPVTLFRNCDMLFLFNTKLGHVDDSDEIIRIISIFDMDKMWLTGDLNFLKNSHCWQKLLNDEIG